MTYANYIGLAACVITFVAPLVAIINDRPIWPNSDEDSDGP